MSLMPVRFLRPQHPDRNRVDAVLDLAGVLAVAHDHRHELGLSRSRARVRADLFAQPPQARRAGGDLVLAHLELEGRPSSVGELDHRVRLEAGVVAVVAQRRVVEQVESARVDGEVAHGEVLEHETERLQVVQERLGGHPEHGAGEARIGEVALGLDGEAAFVARRGHPAGNLLHEEHPLEGVEVHPHAVLVDGRRGVLLGPEHVRRPDAVDLVADVVPNLPAFGFSGSAGR